MCGGLRFEIGGGLPVSKVKSHTKKERLHTLHSTLQYTTLQYTAPTERKTESTKDH